MKKLIGIALVLALAVMLVPSAVFADGSSWVDVKWDDGTTPPGPTVGGYATGVVQSKFQAGDDAIYQFKTSGSGIRGYWKATDTNVCDLGAATGVDTTNSQISAEVLNGYIQMQNDRTDGPHTGYEAGVWGPGGQTSYSLVQAYGASSYGAMALKSASDWANMDEYCYGWYTPNTMPAYGTQFEVKNADTYQILTWVRGAPDPDGAGPIVPICAQVNAVGSGTANLGRCYALNIYNKNLTLGWMGPGYAYYYTADFHANGAGIFTADGWGASSVKFEAMGIGATGDGQAFETDGSGNTIHGVNFGIVGSWTGPSGTCDIANYGLTVK